MRRFGLRELIFVEILAIAVLVLLILVKLAQLPPPISTPPTVSALDFWFQRYQTLSAAVIALTAGLSAYAVARFNHRHEQEKRRQEERNEIVHCFRTCVLAVSRINTGTGTLLHTALKSSSRVLLVDKERQRANSDLQLPEWLSDATSRLPIRFAQVIHLYFHCAQQACDMTFEFEDSTETGSTANRLCREYLLASLVIQAVLYATLTQVEEGGALDVPTASSAYFVAGRVQHFGVTESEFNEALRHIPIDLSELKAAVVQTGIFAAQEDK